MRTGFYTEGLLSSEISFGCLTQGFSDTPSGMRVYPEELEGESFFGSYAQAMEFAGKFKNAAKGAIVYTDGAGGENAFVRALSALLGCPVAGGGAARTTGRTGDGFSAGYGECAVAVFTGPGMQFVPSMKNLHTNIVEECLVEYEGRVLRKINGMDAGEYLRGKKESLGFAPSDFERVTLSTKAHVNAHMSEQNGIVVSGRDPEEHMLLRSVVPGEYQTLCEKFYQENENAIVFGCAGLKGILERPFVSGCLGAFLFGEICSLGPESDFGNLMLSKLVIA